MDWQLTLTEQDLKLNFSFIFPYPIKLPLAAGLLFGLLYVLHHFLHLPNKGKEKVSLNNRAMVEGSHFKLGCGNYNPALAALVLAYSMIIIIFVFNQSFFFYWLAGYR